jgi:uncharacterized repeat protein (TIGR03803 family)
VLQAFGNGSAVQSPRGILAQGEDGLLYGTSLKGGSVGEGTVFSMTPGGAVSALGSFADGSGGTHCNTGLSLGRDGNFYGTCPQGVSPYENGTVFSTSPSGAIATLYAFTGTDGKVPEVGQPVQGLDGKFYGVTESGGLNGAGTAFSIGSDGHLTTLYNFGTTSDDAGSPSGPLMLASDGNFYGTTTTGGKLGGGTVFKMTAAGQVTVLHDFPSSGKREGIQPMGGVVAGDNGQFYGVTFSGGANDLGTVFTLKQTGKVQILHSFSAADSVAFPCDSLTIANDRNFYGEAAACKDGTCEGSAIFEVTSKGVFKLLHTFVSASDGTKASSPLFLSTNGIFYGVTELGGSNGGGTAYSLNTGLQPFVSLSPTSGAIGNTINIYGQGFTQKGTKVLFKGVKAKFKLMTGNYLQAVVPAGATSGSVKVKTPSGTLQSIQVFTVSP